MTSRKTNLHLSLKGQSRKREILNELQSELAKKQNEKKRGRSQRLALLMSFCFLAVAWSWHANVNKKLESQTIPRLATSDARAGSTLASNAVYSKLIEANRENVVNQYVDSRMQSNLSFTLISDEELIVALKSTGESMVLGEIEGKSVLIPAELAP